MNLRNQLEVMELQAVEPPAVNTKPRPARRSWSKALGLAGTLCLHGLVFQSLMYGTRTLTIKPPDQQGTGASRLASDVPPAETLILINPIEPVVTPIDSPVDLSSSGALAIDLRIAILSPDPLPVLKIPDSEKTKDRAADLAIDTSDVEGRAQMFGRYTGQINARIERAWRRPRSPVSGAVSDEPQQPSTGAVVNEEPFSCEVRIVQDARGYVQETLLLKCNGSPEWQRSLIVAINQSSPLPAPPIPSVFSSALTLTFTATAYRSGDSADGYEAENRHVARQPAGSGNIGSRAE